MTNRLEQNPAKPPRNLSGPSKTLWERIRSEYAIADSGGLAILTSACEAHARMGQAAEMLKREGLTIRDARGALRPHPALKIETDNRAQFLAAIKLLSLDVEPLERTPGRPAGGKKPRLQLLQVK
jgi:P27 family predicted phage terminase small subunit